MARKASAPATTIDPSNILIIGDSATSEKEAIVPATATTSETKRRRKAAIETEYAIETATPEELAKMAEWGPTEPASPATAGKASAATVASMAAEKEARDEAWRKTSAEMNAQAEAYFEKLATDSGKPARAPKMQLTSRAKMPRKTAVVAAEAPAAQTDLDAVLATGAAEKARKSGKRTSKAAEAAETPAPAVTTTGRKRKAAEAAKAAPAATAKAEKAPERPVAQPAAKGESKYVLAQFTKAGERERKPGKFVVEIHPKRYLGSVIEYLDTEVADERNTYPRGPRYVCLCVTHGAFERTNLFTSGLTVKPERWCSGCAAGKVSVAAENKSSREAGREAAKAAKAAAAAELKAAAEKAQRKADRDAKKAAKVSKAA